MCGRFALNVSPQELFEQFELPSMPEAFQARYNIAPRTKIVAVRRAPQPEQPGEPGEKREAAELLWWMIPSWAKKLEFKYPTFNAVSETAAEKATFRAAFKNGRRCLIPINGFYEWKGDKGAKKPFFFHVPEEPIMALGGLWERWQGPDQVIESCTILTTEANELVRPIHIRNRMPVIIEREHYETWLNPTTDIKTIMELCRPYAAGRMARYPVGTQVNSVRNESPELMEPTGEPETA